MKAWVLHGADDIRFEDMEMPLLEASEVRVQVKATGICGSDIPRIYETGAHRMPIVPGHEFSGVVTAVGKDADPYWMGRRVGIYPLIPCGTCKPCMSGHPEMCRDYDYIGSRRDGAFAEYVSVPVGNLVEIPDSVSFEETAMLEPMAVVVHAMKRGIGADGETSVVPADARIVICGLGTIGLLLTMFLVDKGFRNIYVIGNKDSQRDKAIDLGISEDDFCDSRSEDVSGWMREIVGGADVYFECVGRNECVSYGIDGMAPGGRVVLVGNPYSDMSLTKDTYWKILRNQLDVTGTWNSTFLQRGYENPVTDDWGYVLNRLTEKKIKPDSLITHRFDLADLDKGFSLMRNKSEPYVKVMMIQR
ncbi:MAG: galactitol-1-phosphate 5-dehydrogenase [Lachnospiraceae bacterium]|nr:galactitol-1-phosphate 5-dehydrogenase [Lachnospiraceae bacterium]